jgi:hypothetical protein
MIAGDKFYPEGKTEPVDLPDIEVEMGPGGDKFTNFLAAIRSRKHTDLNADVLEGHYSAALCHLANMSIRLGGKIPFEPRETAFDDNPEALDTLKRTEEYLAKNGVNLKESGMILGRKLVVDAKSESIANDAEANLLVSRCYRDDFQVPDRIV